MWWAASGLPHSGVPYRYTESPDLPSTRSCSARNFCDIIQSRMRNRALGPHVCTCCSHLPSVGTALLLDADSRPVVRLLSLGKVRSTALMLAALTLLAICGLHCFCFHALPLVSLQTVFIYFALH